MTQYPFQIISSIRPASRIYNMRAKLARTFGKWGPMWSQDAAISRTYVRLFHALSANAGAQGMGMGDKRCQNAGIPQSRALDAGLQYVSAALLFDS